MKLIHKTNIIYFIFTALLLLITGGLLYYMINVIIDKEINEKLLINKNRIALQVKNGHATTELFPIIEVQQLPHLKNEDLIIKDTSLYDPIEEDLEPFCEITSLENINGKPYRITVRQTLLEPHDYLNSIGISLGIMLFVLLIGLFFINRQISRTLWAPFYQNLEILKTFSIQDKKVFVLKETNIKEFKELNKAILILANKIRSDYNLLKEFTENASHEIQTPLAIIQSKLEEILQSPTITEEQVKQISGAYSSAQRLSKLNQTLLLLTKIENHQFNQIEQISLPTFIEKKLDQLEDFIQVKELRVEQHINPSYSINANPILIETLLANLIGNAIKHNLKNGEIKLELSHNTLIISNTGNQSVIAPEKLFERFSKGNSSSESLGLGLSIVKKITEIYQWSIDYTVTDNWHQITIRF